MLLNQIGLYLPRQPAFRMQQMRFMLRRHKTKNKAHSAFRIRSKHNISGNMFAKTGSSQSKSVDKTPYCYEMEKDNEGRCFFLKDNQCTIYTLRPLICRFYPFELKFDQDKNTHVFNFTLECPEIGKGKLLTEKDFKELFLLAKEKLP